ncbi:MAG: hypothetical protein KAS46_08490 [Candidatus Aureabacteria bacterium]|nr:hypothetical protein [Candidatus Auribacterota bacterium]
MLKDIEVLLKVQEQDLKIIEFEKKLKENPELVNRAKITLSQAEADYKEKEEGFKKLQVARKNKEIEVASYNEQIRKLDSQAGTLKDNKAYKALQDEIINARAKIALDEDEILLNMEECDSVAGKVKQSKEFVDQQMRRVKEAEEKSKVENADMEKQICGLKELKKELEKNVSPKALLKYTRLLKNKRGAVIVLSRHGSCSGCNMKLTPQVLMKLKGGMEIVSCETCQRIIYWES